jgi:RHS repeat-associated protein
LPVGSIEGDLQVSPSGSVTYTIPIEVVPGPNGFQPSLSVSYNSLAETGILGTKCSLNGLSVIGRIGQTTYHDGKHSNVCLDTSDRFSMDGMRLMRIGNGSYIANNAQYVPEIENYTRVTAVNVTNGQPDYFSATTENGTIIQYGNGNNSQQAVNGKIVNWLISSATNINENRIIYNYGQANGEIWLNSISYGPYNIKPYGQVFFEYDDYTHLQSTFVGGYEIKYHKLLRQIIVKYSNTVVRRYVFNYEQDYDFNTNSDSIPLLKEVVLYGSDGTQLNSTNIDWYPPTTMESSISNPPPTYNLFSLSPRKHIVSDFNNDGACDIVQWHNSPEYVFLSNGNTVTIPSIPHYPITECISMDIDGSGYNKLLTVHELDTDNHVIICCTDFHSQSNPVTDIFLNFYPNQSFNQIFAADITGDGKEEAIVWYDNTKLKIKGEICDFTTTIAFGTPKFGDFNGNGKVDILVINNSSTGEYRIYEYNTVSESLVESLHETNYNVVGAITVGDFNGDGVSDLLCNNSGYRVSFGSNNKFPTSIGIDYYNDTGNPNQNPTLPVVVDLNGDGKDDLIGFNRIFGLRCTYYINCGYVNNKLILYHYPNIQTNLLTQQELNYGGYFSVGDIDNDKLPELLVYKPIDGYQCNLQVHKFNGMRKTPLVSSITDGIGKQHTIDYRLFSGKTMRYGSYRRQPVVMYLPDTLHCSDGLGSNSLLSFEYKNVCFSHNRRCFLGFEEFNTHNPSTQTTVSELFTPNSNICLLLPQKSETFVQSNYNPIRETITSYTHFQLSAGMVLQPSQVIEKDNLNQTSRVTNNTYHPQTGKLYEMEELTRITGSQDFVTKNTTTYTYSLVTLPNGVQKYRKNSESIVSEMTGSTAGITANRLIRYLYKNGRLSKIINSDNGGFSDTVNYTYNNKGQLVSQQHKAANCATETTHYTYDGTKRFVTSKSNDYFTEFTRTYDNATGNVLTETDANGLTTSYQYDAFGRLVLEQSPYGTYTQYSYEWFSSDIPHSIYRQKMISPGTPTAYVYYDILGREICKQTGNIRTDVRYNSLGQREKESHPYYFSWTDDLKKWHNFQYDLYGRLSAEIAPYKDLSYSYSERQQTVHDNIRNTDNVKLHDAAGRLVQSTDPGGTINYSYKYVSDNNLIRTENTFSAVGATTTVVSDLQDNRLSFTEPNAGVVNSVYDNFGRLVSQTDARGVTTVFTYDLLNRCVRKQFASGGDTLTHTFIYDSLDATNVWKGAMMAVRVNDSNAVFYHYDNVGRLVEKITRIEGEDFSFGYTYDSLNRSNTVIYPNNFAIKYDYDEESRVYAIRNNTTQAKLYKVRDRDLLQRAKIIVYDNETGSQYYRNDYGNIIRIRQGNTLFPEDMLGRDSLILEEQPFIDKEYRELYYTYNDAGLMSSRKDSVTHFQETFEYDNLDRLTAFTVTKTDGSITELHTTSFADNGNILANSHVGTYHYDCDKPHAVTGITLDSTFVNAISAARCDVHYNLFNQPDTIKEGQWKLVLYYGPDQTRWKTVLFKDSNVFETHWYIGDDYEKVTNSSNETAHFNIVRGEENAVVIGYQGYGSDFYYYVHPDILGNWCVINGPGERPRLIHFDPWGNPRKFNNWTLVDSTTLANSILPARGFTGHEHLQRFNIINMKGRLYDPVIGRFFSPDNFVQLPDFTQNYNRYSYCLNNPLKYVDPSGEGFADALLWISNFLSIPARIFTEGVECFNDLINGEIQESGYFHWDYLTGTASPYPVDTRNIIYNQVDHNEFYDISKSHSSVIDADNISFAYEMYWAGFEMYGYEFQKGSGKTWYQRSKYKKWGHINIRRTKIDDLDDILSKSNMYIGCFGTGLKKVKGSVRFTNGIFNGNHLSYKYYATGWNGGSRAGIKTYNVGKLGKTISRTTMGLSVLYGVNEVADGYMLDGGRWGYNSNMALFKTIGSTGGSIMGAEIGAEIGLLFGGFGAIPGALIGGIIFDYFGEKAGEQLIINMY